MARKKILSIVKTDLFQEMWKHQIGDKAEMIVASSIEDATALFDQHHDIDLIIIHASLPGGILNIVKLVIFLRGGFRGPIIAASGIDRFRTKLLKAGCSHQSSINDVPRIVAGILWP